MEREIPEADATDQAREAFPSTRTWTPCPTILRSPRPTPSSRPNRSLRRGRVSATSSTAEILGAQPTAAGETGGVNDRPTVDPAIKRTEQWFVHRGLPAPHRRLQRHPRRAHPHVARAHPRLPRRGRERAQGAASRSGSTSWPSSTGSRDPARSVDAGELVAQAPAPRPSRRASARSRSRCSSSCRRSCRSCSACSTAPRSSRPRSTCWSCSSCMSSPATASCR